MDDRIWSLALVLVIYIIVNVVNDIGMVIAKRTEGRTGCAFGLLWIPMTVVLVALCGWMILLLWEILTPVFDLPEIDLIQAYAISTLAGLLVRGPTPVITRERKLPGED